MSNKPFRFEIEPTVGPDGKPAQYFVTLVKFGPGYGPKDFMKFLYEHDKYLVERKKPTRHERGIHEDQTFITIGNYDMVIVWRAPNFEAAKNYLNDFLNPDGTNFGGSTDTLTATGKGGT